MAPRNSVLGIDRGGFSYSNKQVFSGVSFALDDARTALVGENGAGKSTLLKCLTGELQLNEGQLVRSRGFRCGYLAQDVPETLLALTLRQILEAMLARIHSTDDWKIDVLRAELGIEPERAELPFGSFSGGWQRLILIAAATSIEEPDLLILDEPTNHLDLTNIGRLEDWLLNHTDVPMLIVSHDREFLERVTTRTVFLRSDGVHVFKAPFSLAREELLQRDMANAKQRALEDKEIDRLKKVANRYKAWGVLNSDFHKKQKATEKRIDKIQDNRADSYVKKNRELAFHDGALDAKIALRIEDLTVTTPPDAAGASRALYHIDSLLVRPGDRIAILGTNGTGKSMLLQALARTYQPNRQHYDASGPIRYSPACNLVYFDQRMQALPLKTSLLDYIEDGDPSTRTRNIALLARIGFNFERAKSQIAHLSYGERSRLLFLRMKLMQPNFYLLDEPTNHIDIEGQEDLEEQLTNTEVSCIFVSHDRYFTRSAATRFMQIRQTKTRRELVEVESPDAFFASQLAA